METMTCTMCGKNIIRKSKTQKYCIRCGNIANRERTKANYKKRTSGK